MAAGNYIFVSCGQYHESERQLGKQIVAMVKNLTGLTPFFAQEVHNLDGLHNNILDALRNCAALIVILHPRGEITCPGDIMITRASVWIEQELAIAAYIQRVERKIPIYAFKHSSIALEGIRTLINVNPIEFTRDAEVLVALPELLKEWKSLPPSSIELLLESPNIHRVEQEHQISTLTVTLVNGTGQRIREYTCDVRFPADIVKHWEAHYGGELPSGEPGRKLFRFTEAKKGVIEPGDKMVLLSLNYCTRCAGDAAERSRQPRGSVAEQIVEVIAWVDGRKYEVKKSIKDLAVER